MKNIAIVGGGLAGSEAALALSRRGFFVHLFEMRPHVNTEVHKTSDLAELVCSNSLKSSKLESAAGLLKKELECLDSVLYKFALENSVAAGGALAVDRNLFSAAVTDAVNSNNNIELIREEVKSIEEVASSADALILATGPLTTGSLFESIASFILVFCYSCIRTFAFFAKVAKVSAGTRISGCE